jgi:hypothetical protein
VPGGLKKAIVEATAAKRGIRNCAQLLASQQVGQKRKRDGDVPWHPLGQGPHARCM